MTKNDEAKTRESDYLFDPTASPDGEVQALERALQPWRASDESVPERVLAIRRRRRRGPILVALAGAAAAVLGWWLFGSSFFGRGELRPGSAERSFAAHARALEVPLGALATLELAPGGRLEFVRWLADGEARVRLLRGRVAVRPGPAAAAELVVETGVGRASARGAAFVVGGAPDTAVRVAVTAGEVRFVGASREVLVPAGAVADVRPALPGTPRFEGTSPTVRELLERYDDALLAADPRRRRDVADKLRFNRLSPRETLPLWHLLQDADAAVQKLARDALRQLTDGGPSPDALATPERWLAFLRARGWR